MGTMLQICNVIDDHTRAHVTFAVNKTPDAASVIKLLDIAFLARGQRPRAIRMDNKS